MMCLKLQCIFKVKYASTHILFYCTSFSDGCLIANCCKCVESKQRRGCTTHTHTHARARKHAPTERERIREKEKELIALLYLRECRATCNWYINKNSISKCYFIDQTISLCYCGWAKGALILAQETKMLLKNPVILLIIAVNQFLR